MMSDTLTPKQATFCQEYVIDHNAKQAAIRTGYSEKTAESQGSYLLSNPKVRSKVAELEADIQSINKDLKQRLIDELTLIAEYDINDYIEVVACNVDKTLKDGTTISYEIEQIRLRDGYNGKAVSKIKMGLNGLEVTFHDKTKAIELIGKHLGLFNEQEEKPILSAEVVID